MSSKLRLRLAVALCICTAQPVAAASGMFSPAGTGPASTTTPVENYRLRPLDRVSVKVFGEDKLGVEKVQIDAGGQLVLPLIGQVTAKDKTAAQLSNEIATRLGERYLQSPSVAVLLDEAANRQITISGAVVESGMYNLQGPTTLLQAVAMAKGVDPKLADAKNILVIRKIDGYDARAVFDLKAIQAGQAQDPEILAGDSVVVDASQAKSIWREILAVLPGIAVFSYF